MVVEVLCKVVAASISHSATGGAGMDLLYQDLGLLPVVAELLLAAHGPLGLSQPGFMPPETVQRLIEPAVGQGGKAGNAHIDTHSASLRDRLLQFPPGLNGYKPPTAGQTDGDIAQFSGYAPAVAVANPAQFRQADPAVGLIQPDLLTIGVAKAVVLTLLPELWKTRPPFKEIPVGLLQVLERLLQRMNRGLGQPGGFLTVTPGSEPFCHGDVA